MFPWILASFLLCLTLYFYILRPHRYWKDLGVKHGKPLFLFGDTLGTILNYESFAEIIQRVYNSFPGERYAGFYQFLVPTLMLRDPELIKQITVKDYDHFLDHRTIIDEDVDPLFGNNLFTMKGDRWKHMRATLSPTFTSSKMKIMFVLMSDVAQRFVQHFKEERTSVELKDIFTRFTNDVIATTAFGIEVDSIGEKDHDFYLKGKDITNFSSLRRNLKFFGYFMFPSIYKWFKISFIESNLANYFRKVVLNNVNYRQSKGIIRQDMLNLLMQARQGIQSKEETGIIETGFATAQESNLGKSKIRLDLTDDDLVAQALIFFFAGFDSVSTLMCFMGYELALNQDIQDRLREEIQETHRECNGELTYETLMKMKYLDMVISESLRLWPVASGIDRVCTKPYTIQPKLPGEKPLNLPVGTVLMLPMMGLHRDPQYYPDPEKFDPERFNEENKGKIKPYTYIPFGSGPRNCIGSRFAILETKIIMFHILIKLRIVPNKKTVIPLRIAKNNFNMTAEGGFFLDFEKL